MTSQNAFIFFPQGCIEKEGLLLGVNITEFEIVVLDIIDDKLFTDAKLKDLLLMPNLNYLNNKVLENDLKVLGRLSSTDNNNLDYSDDLIEKKYFADIWVNLQLDKTQNNDCQLLFKSLDLCGYRYDVRCQLAFYNEKSQEICHNEMLIKSLMNHDFKIQLNLDQTYEDNLLTYQASLNEDEYYKKAYCFGINQLWLWNQIKLTEDFKWAMKMEKFEKAFMIINLRKIILMNFKIMAEQDDLYEQYKDKIPTDDMNSTALDQSLDSFDLAEECLADFEVSEIYSVDKQNNLITTPFYDNAGKKMAFFEESGEKKQMKSPEKKKKISKISDSPYLDKKNLDLPMVRDLEIIEEVVNEEIPDINQEIINHTKSILSDCGEVELEKNELSVIMKAFRKIMEIMVFLNTMFIQLNYVLYVMPIFFFRLPQVAELLFSKTYRQLLYKIKTFKDSVRCIYIRENNYPKFSVQNIEFVKRIVSGQHFQFVDAILGLFLAFLMMFYRDLSFQKMLQANHYVGKIIGEFDIEKNIPFGLKPDKLIFDTIAHLNYIFLQQLSEAFYILSFINSYVLWLVIICLSTQGFSVAISLIIDIYSILVYPFKLIYVFHWIMFVELMTLMKHLKRICFGERFNPNDDRIEIYHYDVLSRAVVVAVFTLLITFAPTLFVFVLITSLIIGMFLVMKTPLSLFLCLYNHFPCCQVLFKSKLKNLLPEYIELESLRYHDKTHYFIIKSKMSDTGFFMKGLFKALSKLQEINEFKGLMVSVMPQSHPTKEKLWIWKEDVHQNYKTNGIYTDLTSFWTDYSIFTKSLYVIHKK